MVVMIGMADMVGTAAVGVGSGVLPRETIVTSARYERIVADIRSKIHAGELRPGDRLPSTRELREQYGCSQVTVRTAILLLQTEGLLRGDQGVGVFVANPLPE